MVEKIDWVSKDTVSYGPQIISTQNYGIVNGQISVSVSGCNASSGYRIYITKGDGTSVIEPSEPAKEDICSGGIYKLINRNSQKALGVSGDATNNGAEVIQWSDNGKTSQQWKISDTGEGYILMNINANKALDVDNCSTKDGGDVLLWYDNGQPNQRWFIQNIGDGYYTLENVNSGKLLDVEKESKDDGGNVIQWAGNGGANQQWKLVRVDQPEVLPSPSLAPSTNPEISTAPNVSSEPEETTKPVDGVTPVVSVKTENNGNTITQSYTIQAQGGTVDLSKVKIDYTATGMDSAPQTVWVDNAALSLNVAPYYESLGSDVTASINGKVLSIAIAGQHTLQPDQGSCVINLRFAKNDRSVQK